MSSVELLQPWNVELLKKEGRHESYIRERIKEIQKPFLEACWNEWGELERPDGKKRGWFNCSPMSIALSRILSLETGVPIGIPSFPKQKGDEYFEFIARWYDPLPPRGKIDDHFLLVYDNGGGCKTLIDVNGQLLWGGKTLEDPDAILLAKYPSASFASMLEREHHLYPYYLRGESYARYLSQQEQLIDTIDELETRDYIDAMHSDASTKYVGPFKGLFSGRQIADVRWGKSIGNVVRAFHKDWNEA